MSQESLKTGSIDKFELTASMGGKSVDLSAGITDLAGLIDDTNI